MKLSKIILTFLILFAAAQFCLGQDTPPKAWLIDEYEKLNCESVLGRVDSFMVDIANRPASIGYAVINPKKGTVVDAYEQESWIKGNIYFRKFYKDRLLIVRGEERDAPQTQFWLVPAGADKPEFKESNWTELFRYTGKAFVFFTSYGVSSCPANLVQPYVDFLIAHPDTRGHIVIPNKNRREGRKEVEWWLKMFTDGDRISRDRFKIFFAKGRVLPDYEFWVVPVKKKK